MPMPSTSSTLTSSSNITILFLLLFILAFFPGLPQFFLYLPLYLLPKQLTSVFSSSTSPTTPVPLTTCCTLPPSYQTSFPDPTAMSAWFQKSFTLPSQKRGSYLITQHITQALPEIKDYKVGLLHLFVQHTSCALSLNENWDEEVRLDMTDALERIVPKDKKGDLYRHAAEGEDDMPAHIKAALVGASVSIPVSDGKLNLGTWQGIWYLEFRDSKHTRKVVATIQGEKR